MADTRKWIFEDRRFTYNQAGELLPRVKNHLEKFKTELTSNSLKVGY